MTYKHNNVFFMPPQKTHLDPVNSAEIVSVPIDVRLRNCELADISIEAQLDKGTKRLQNLKIRDKHLDVFDSTSAVHTSGRYCIHRLVNPRAT